MSNLKIASVRGTATPSVGTFSVTVVNSEARILLQLYLKSTTSTTTFDVTIIDVWGNSIYESIDNTGTHNAFLSVPATQYGNWTLQVSNASAAEVFTYLLLFKES
jgi:hypothetical protein